jgi:hypothetical protein
MRSFVIAAFVALAFASAADSAQCRGPTGQVIKPPSTLPKCVKGVLCGNRCIPANQACHPTIPIRKSGGNP